MTAIIIIGIIIFIIYTASSKKKPTRQNTTYINPYNRKKSEKEIRDELLQDIGKRRFTVTSPNSSINNCNDESIIDVTDQSIQINTNSSLKKQSYDVPYWAHHYVYSYSELKGASVEQKKFYFFFKNSFLNGEYLDLEGNTNYSFILLFNILEEYENHKDIAVLEKQLKTLGQNYPKTKSYCNSFLIKKMNLIGYTAGVTRIQEEERYNYQSYNTDYDSLRLGNRYKEKSHLTDLEVSLLNSIYVSQNKFSQIPFFHFEIFKLFISVIRELLKVYDNKLDGKIYELAKRISIEHLGYKENTNMYNPIEGVFKEIYNCIWKHCDNYIRNEYKYNAFTNVFSSYYVDSGRKIIIDEIINNVDSIIENLIPLSISPLSEQLETKLNSLKPNRWKIIFKELTNNYNGNSKDFVNSIVLLGNLNKQSLSIENIFFEASKFIAKHDSESALTLYIHYLYHDLKSASFDNKQLTKTIQKSLFKTDKQLHDFEKIVSELIRDKDLDKALRAVSKIYEVKRKKIKLDTVSIKDIKQQHWGTVELLNEYLKDDVENDISIENTQIEEDKEFKIETILQTEKSQNSIDIVFTQIQTSALDFFTKNNFSVLQSEFETFAKSKGIFKNQLIESINDICYEYLDDILIGEDDEYYTINQDYYNTILAK